MKYSHPFPLKCYRLLSTYVEKYMSTYVNDPIYMVKISLPDRVKNILDSELNELGLSKSIGTVAFKRNTSKEFDKLKFTHVDYDTITDKITDASIIIPISGCEDTRMFWATGNYSLIKGYDSQGNSRMDVDWITPGQVVYEEEIIQPTLVRVNVPHGAYSRQDGTYRLILSIRLERNEEFDRIVEIL